MSVAGDLGLLTEREIFAQPHLWSEVYRDVLKLLPAVRSLWSAVSPREILLTGCGSSFYLATSAACILRTTVGVPSLALPSSEIMFADFDGKGRGRPPLLIAISRSGETTETVWALQRVKQRGSTTIAVTCHEGGTLARSSDLPVGLPVNERSVVMTGSFTSMLLALALVAADLGGDRQALADLRDLAELGLRHMSTLAALAQTAAAVGRRSYVFLGSGRMYGVACEGALKMTEMALQPSWAYHTLEYLHGPKAALSADTLVVGLLSNSGMPHERKVLEHVAELGGGVLAIGGHLDHLPSLSLGAAGSVPTMLLAGVWMQLLALYVARDRGVNPDTPRFLDPVVTWAPDLTKGGEG